VGFICCSAFFKSSNRTAVLIIVLKQIFQKCSVYKITLIRCSFITFAMKLHQIYRQYLGSFLNGKQ